MNERKACLRLLELESLDEEITVAQQYLELYQQKMSNEFNERV